MVFPPVLVIIALSIKGLLISEQILNNTQDSLRHLELLA